MKIRRISALIALVLAIGASAWGQIPTVGDGGPGPVKAQHLTVEMVSLAPSIVPGGTLEVGLVITLEEKWHVYWINAGDSGEPPKITWTLPRGVMAGPMRFPVPRRSFPAMAARTPAASIFSQPMTVSPCTISSATNISTMRKTARAIATATMTTIPGTMALRG